MIAVDLTGSQVLLARDALDVYRHTVDAAHNQRDIRAIEDKLTVTVGRIRLTNKQANVLMDALNEYETFTEDDEDLMRLTFDQLTGGWRADVRRSAQGANGG